VVIFDTSMQPALRPGDRLLAARWRPARPGDIVLFRDPEATRTLLVKRVVARSQRGHLSVRGDNPNVSRDSRHFGPVPPTLVIGTIVYRYLPAARRGRL
jgi:nickel-type superoxide dismutase maturation protease